MIPVRRVPPSIDPFTLPPIGPNEAERADARGAPWRIRVVFVGPNPENVSGRSDKWWEACAYANADRYRPIDATESGVVRWGATGSSGQARVITSGSMSNAIEKAREKIRKGYVLDSTLRANAAPPPKASFQELVNRATWRSGTTDDALLIVGSRGLVALHVGLEATHHGLPVLPYLAEDGSVWGMVVPDADRSRIYYAQIRVRA